MNSLVLFLALLCLCLYRGCYSATNTSSSLYELHYHRQNHLRYAWEDVSVSVLKPMDHRMLLSEQAVVLSMKGVHVSQFTTYKVFVSLTTISSRIYTVWKSIYSILNGIVIPTQIFLFISRDGYLIDEGIKTIPNNLLALVAMNLLRIVYTDNIGPHRKLLPLAGKYYNDNSTLIVNIDDDMAYTANSTLLYHLLHRFMLANESSVVALRVRRIGLCNGRSLRYTRYYSWNVLYTTGRNEMLLLPTGTGGILYKPQFFHPIVFSEQFRHVTGTGDDLMFRLACIANNIPVIIACRDLEYRGRIIRKCPVDLISMLKSKRLMHPVAATDNQQKDESMYLDKTDSNSHATRHLSFDSLYSINRNGKNDEQFFQALAYLSSQNVIPKFSDVIAKYYSERDSKCYALNNKNQAYCSIYSCKTKKIQLISNSSKIA